MAKRNTTYKTLKKWVRISIKSMIVVFFVMGVYLLISSLNLNAPVVNVLLSYNIEQNPEYKVNIIDNNYIDENSLNLNENYITDLVSNIELSFKYIYEATKKGNYNYDYDIKATINGEYQGSVENQNKNFWTKEYKILEKKCLTANDTNSISVDERIILDFQQYNTEVTNFKKELNVPINANLEVLMTINVNGEADNNKVKDTKTQKFIIPLNQLIFSITNEAKATDHQEITHTDDNRPINMIKFDVGVVMIVYSISLLAVTFKLIFKTKSKFDSELDRILKTYSDIIVELASSISIEGKEIVLVKGFNEMLDLEEELRIPINFIQTERNEGKFFIVNNDICYMWVLEEAKEEQEKVLNMI